MSINNENIDKYISNRKRESHQIRLFDGFYIWWRKLFFPVYGGHGGIDLIIDQAVF